MKRAEDGRAPLRWSRPFARALSELSFGMRHHETSSVVGLGVKTDPDL